MHLCIVPPKSWASHCVTTDALMVYPRERRWDEKQFDSFNLTIFNCRTKRFDARFLFYRRWTMFTLFVTDIGNLSGCSLSQGHVSHYGNYVKPIVQCVNFKTRLEKSILISKSYLDKEAKKGQSLTKTNIWYQIYEMNLKQINQIGQNYLTE